jgi:Icc-related predicted phosphoesterase
MKIVVISDTHCHKVDLPEGDLLIHAGDLSTGGHRSQIQPQLNWLDRQHDEKGYKDVVVVAGNHDKKLEDPSQFNFRRLIYLDNESTHINGLHIYGSPCTPKFYNWSFMHERGEPIKRIWDRIPDDVDILITHGPPFGIGDLVRGRHTGCLDLLHAVQRVKPALHVFGHIHEGYGAYVADAIPNVYFVNAAIMDDDYIPLNKPQVIEWQIMKQQDTLEL